ncbi:MAG: peptide chain release factor N(5)-glutamine methyltransferase [Rickettsiaceae bacterium]|nr:peptide chain release factor N(5)-glutamine methyltransferase [Rickettsiaceae bacterium]
MNIKQALQFVSDELQAISANNVFLEVRILLSYILQKPIEYILSHYGIELSYNQQELLEQLVTRRKNHEPIAYIIGETEFYSRRFFVDHNVLIPRPDSEVLIDAVLKYNEGRKEVKILDLGTGSGILAITLAKELDQATIVATDISNKALEIARKNAKALEVTDRTTFINSNWYENVRVGEFDIIISNPPYIATNEESLMAKETLLYEPKMALFAKSDGLANYHQIIKDAKKYLNSNGLVVLEIGFKQAAKVTEILEEHGYKVIAKVKDLAGHSRVLVAI